MGIHNSHQLADEPVDPEALVATVRALLRLRRTERALSEANTRLETLNRRLARSNEDLPAVRCGGQSRFTGAAAETGTPACCSRRATLPFQARVGIFPVPDEGFANVSRPAQARAPRACLCRFLPPAQAYHRKSRFRDGAGWPGRSTPPFATCCA
jgi:hypothetical protein